MLRLDNFKSFLGKTFVDALKRSIKKNRPRGGFSAPIEYTGSLSQGLEVKEGSDRISILGNEYAINLDEGLAFNRVDRASLRDWALRKAKIEGGPRTIETIARKLESEGPRRVPFIQEVVDDTKMMQVLQDGGAVELVKDIEDKLRDILVKGGYIKEGDKFVIK